MPPRPPIHRRKRKGTTLIELLVALLLFDIALLGVVAASAVAVRRVAEAGRRSRATIAAASRVERLMIQSCASASSGNAPLENRVTETWSSTALPGGREILDSIRVQSIVDDHVVLRARVAC